MVNWASAADIDVRLFVDRDRQNVGQQVTLTVEFSGASQAPPPQVAVPSGLQIQYVGPITKMESRNGDVSRSVSHRYVVTATQPGQYRIGPLDVKLGNQTFRTGAVTLAFSKAAEGKSGSNLPLDLVVTPSKTRVYVGERLPVTLALQIGNVRVDDLNYPVINGSGFSTSEMGAPGQRTDVINGRRVRIVEFRTVITPLTVGSVELGPVTIGVEVLQNRSGARNDPFSFFGRTERKTVTVTAAPILLDVQALPTEGRPADFSGAVGRFDFRASAKPVELAVGDPVTISMEIRGFGNLDGFSPPGVAEGPEFKTYEPQIVEADKPARHAFEQVIIPNDASVKQIPQLRFTFFDPIGENYVTAKRGPFGLKVRRSRTANTSGPAVEVAPSAGQSAGSNQEKPLGRDIVFIKENPGRVSSVSNLGRVGPLFWLLQIFGLVVLVGAFMRARRLARLGANPELTRFRSATGEAERRLATIRSGVGETDWDSLQAAMQEFFSAKLGLPLGACDVARVEDRLKTLGRTDELRASVRQFFSFLDSARYAGSGQGSQAFAEALDLADVIVGSLEAIRPSTKSPRALLALALMVFVTPLVSCSDIPSDSISLFYEGNRHYADGDYDQATEVYDQVHALGAASAALHFNAGNAWYKRGDLGRALLHYERARDLAPRDPDARANQIVAREDAGLGESEDLGAHTWSAVDFVTPLSRRFTYRELAMAGGLVWSLAVVCLVLFLLIPNSPRVLRSLGLALVALALFLACNALVRHRSFEGLARLAVIQPGETTVLFEPREGATTHFTVRQGQIFEAGRDSGAWLQVVGEDGLKGWIPTDRVELLWGTRQSDE